MMMHETKKNHGSSCFRVERWENSSLILKPEIKPRQEQSTFLMRPQPKENLYCQMRPPLPQSEIMFYTLKAPFHTTTADMLSLLGVW